MIDECSTERVPRPSETTRRPRHEELNSAARFAGPFRDECEDSPIGVMGCESAPFEELNSAACFAGHSGTNCLMEGSWGMQQLDEELDLAARCETIIASCDSAVFEELNLRCEIVVVHCAFATFKKFNSVARCGITRHQGTEEPM